MDTSTTVTDATAAAPGMPEVDVERLAALRRMKVVALALLIFAAVAYLWARNINTGPNPPGWAGYAQAAAEAGMVGGLADWFAVTALFRHPLGLPIPHTAIIPRRKEQLGDSLGDFVGENFLSPDVIRQKLGSVNIGYRLGEYLDDYQRSRRIAAEAAVWMSGVIEVLKDETVGEMLSSFVKTRLQDLPLGATGGRLLTQVVNEQAHVGMVDVTINSVHQWLLDHREDVVGIVEGQAPSWAPKVANEFVANEIYKRVTQFSQAVKDEKSHALRRAIDDALLKLASDLQQDPETQDQAENLKRRLLEHPDVMSALNDLGVSIRSSVLDAVNDPTSTLRVRMVDGLVSLGQRLKTDEQLRGKVDGWVEGAAVYAVENYTGEITGIITDTVNRWDGKETSRKIELQVGKDLQYIRINGTVVGAIAGVLIYAVGHAVVG